MCFGITQEFEAIELKDVCLKDMAQNDWIDTFLISHLASKSIPNLKKLALEALSFSEEYQNKAIMEDLI